ncbi:hypothetical protein GCM10007907_16390 [Chitinimonas prasina]|uniref:Uncharacterized protein n=1 Tax=Chitinimonas prasina TaxID=1434937 RepID=A0ABQ5YDH7_9NEIS|nr:hypothetical protein GCM10007907_16390 [Chitinimonas prasina]
MRSHIGLVALVGVLVLGNATAADPGPAAAVYQSAFDAYAPWQAQLPPPQWQAVNKEMAVLGGHAGHAKAQPGQADMKHHHAHHGKKMTDQQQPSAAPAEHQHGGG